LFFFFCFGCGGGVWVGGRGRGSQVSKRRVHSMLLRPVQPRHHRSLSGWCGEDEEAAGGLLVVVILFKSSGK
jgi:hypothetical protein